MFSILLNGVIYLNINLELKQNDKFIEVYNSNILLDSIEYDNAAEAETDFNNIISGINSGATFLNLDDLEFTNNKTIDISSEKSYDVNIVNEEPIDVSLPNPDEYESVLLYQEVSLLDGVAQTISIPSGANKIQISAYVDTGETATIKLGESTIGIPLNDTSGGYVSPSNGILYSKVNQVVVESTGDATLYLLVEGVE